MGGLYPNLPCMDSEQPKRSSTAFEYFLYTAILAETGLAALIYKVIFRSPDFARMRIYFAIFYFGFLAWAIAQLNMLHRNRTPDSPAQSPEPAEEPREHSHEDTRPAFGLTGAQLAIVVLVFATAVATFSVALRLLP
jgi:hypothetical protein